MLEVMQRFLDAWMRVLWEAGLNLEEYRVEEERLNTEGLFYHPIAEGRLVFEYGEHVNGWRIHVVELWSGDWYSNEEFSTTGSAPMPCILDFDDTEIQIVGAQSCFRRFS